LRTFRLFHPSVGFDFLGPASACRARPPSCSASAPLCTLACTHSHGTPEWSALIDTHACSVRRLKCLVRLPSSQRAEFLPHHVVSLPGARTASHMCVYPNKNETKKRRNVHKTRRHTTHQTKTIHEKTKRDFTERYKQTSTKQMGACTRACGRAGDRTTTAVAARRPLSRRVRYSVTPSRPR